MANIRWEWPMYQLRFLCRQWSSIELQDNFGSNQERWHPYEDRHLFEFRIAWQSWSRISALFPKEEWIVCEKDILLWDYRVVVPTALRQVLKELQASHIGMVKVKFLARSYVWWPKFDEDFEKIVRSCYACNTFKDKPQRQLLYRGNGQLNLGSDFI